MYMYMCVCVLVCLCVYECSCMWLHLCVWVHMQMFMNAREGSKLASGVIFLDPSPLYSTEAESPAEPAAHQILVQLDLLWGTAVHAHCMLGL